jgi:hypothetical protein
MEKHTKKSNNNKLFYLVILLTWPIILLIIFSKIFFYNNIPNSIEDLKIDDKLKQAIVDADYYLMYNNLTYSIIDDTLKIMKHKDNVPIAFLGQNVEVYDKSYKNLINDLLMLKYQNIYYYSKYQDKPYL